MAAAPKREDPPEAAAAAPTAKRRRWDEGAAPAVKAEPKSEWDEEDEKPAAAATTTAAASAWETPVAGRGAAAALGGGATPKVRRNRWDETPVSSTPSARPLRSRWDETPVSLPSFAADAAASSATATPAGPHGMALATPAGPHGMAAGLSALRAERELEERNRPLTDEELDALLPAEGYAIVEPPADYQPVRTPARRLQATPTGSGGDAEGFVMHEDARTEGGADAAAQAFGLIEMPEGLPPIKPEDQALFKSLMTETDEALLDAETQKDRKVLKLLLKVKNGTPPMRKQAMRQLTDRAVEFGPKALFNNILPLLMSVTLEEQERHLLVKVVDRVLYKLDDLVRPFVHDILVVIEPMLIDENYYTRAEGREIISNLAKAAGLATMIAMMRPNIDHVDEYVRNTTARAFSVVASALGIPALLPFLKAVCQSRKSWQARHTGIKIVQQVSILMGCAVLPHLRSLVEIIEAGLQDEQPKVRTITALALAALAEASTPYGIESFDSVLRPLWYGIREHRGKGLAAFLKAIGFIIPLMDAENASYYTAQVMPVLVREFSSADDEMKKIVLKVIKQAIATEGVEAAFVRTDVLPEYFKCFWIRRMALDRRNSKQLVETTVELAKKVGGAEIIGKVVDVLKDESEPFRRMAMDAIDHVVSQLGIADVDQRLEEQLVDGILYAFQEQASGEDAQAAAAILNGFGTVVNALGMRAKPYLPQIAGTIKWRLNNKSAGVREQAADLIARIAVVMRNCGEEALLGHMGQILYEYLGEEFPEVLGSIIGALKAIVNVIGMSQMNPPIKDLLPRLTPILKNRHEKVQENVIDLVGRIADRGSEFVSAREWMRICFDLLEMLNARKLAIRRAAVNAFGYIARAIGPSDVLMALLNNLRVQERQVRVCTTVAIGVVGETCGPFTILPALMNEYRVPELNVQNGVLKSLSFLFEYIGEVGKDYIYAVAPLLEDALIDRDLVHRQTACSVVKHMALGVPGMGCEDVLLHLLNFVWPNIFEASPHIALAFSDAIDGMRVSVGPATLLLYLLPGLWHPARAVRNAYWKLYNSLYIGAQDALTACYPRIPDDGHNRFARSELDLLF